VTRLAPHPHAALEYWFFKVNAGPVALLVDWIARRRVSENVLRVSIHSPQGRAVLFETQTPLFGERSFLHAERTVGRAGNVEWELEIEPGDGWIAPDIFPAALLGMTDLTLVSAPLVFFTGWIRHSDRQFEVQRSPGMVSHYWGRGLAPEWWWVSANQFDREEVAVECTVLRTGLWGLPLRFPLAYLHLGRGKVREMAIAPLAGAQVTGSSETFEIRFRRFGAETITLSARGRDYGDLGDGIVNTLVGDLEIREGRKIIGRAEGTAGLERRAPK
jgi:hypothetical protein